MARPVSYDAYSAYSAGEAAEEAEEEPEQGLVDLRDGPTHQGRPVSDQQRASSIRFQESRAGSAQRETFYGG
eukprot:5277926-Amphidinium_carterae.1